MVLGWFKRCHMPTNSLILKWWTFIPFHFVWAGLRDLTSIKENMAEVIGCHFWGKVIKRLWFPPWVFFCPPLFLPFSFLHSYYLLWLKSATMFWGYSGSLPATTWASLEAGPPQSNLEMIAILRDPEPEPSSQAASRFLTHKNCDRNCRTISNWLYPVSNKIPSCFSDTANQNHRSCSWGMRRDNFDLQLLPEPKYPPPPETKGLEYDWPELEHQNPFRSEGSIVPGRSGAEAPYHILP